MATLTITLQLKSESSPDLHPIVGDRVIQGEGTATIQWQQWQPLQTLPRIDVATHFPPHQRVCIFAPHPDDEILGCGGLLQQLAQQGNPLVVVRVTNGTQSHPNSAQYSPTQLNHLRPQESQAAFKVLGIEQQVGYVPFNLMDGNVYQQREEFFHHLEQFIRADDILVTVFCHDGHPDHEATGQVVQEFANQRELKCYQVMIWAWHWAKPDDNRVPWHKALRLDMSEVQQTKKRQAMACFATQILPDPSTGQPPVLSLDAIERLTQPWEVYIDDAM